MKNFIKKYWPHTLNLFFIIFSIYAVKFYSMVIINDDIHTSPAYAIALLIIELVVVLGVIGEIIYFIIKAAKSKELANKGLHIAGIYFLNIFYIPCFNLKHVQKDDKSKVKNIIYVVAILCLYILFNFYVIKFQSVNYDYDKYVSNDNVISINIPNDFKKQLKVGNFDMYFSKGDTYNIGVFIYDNTGDTAEEIMNYQENYLTETRKNFKVTDKYTINKNGKNITILNGKAEHDGYENYYYVATVTFDNKKDYVVCALGSSIENNEEKSKKEFERIMNKIELNQ